MNHRPWLTFGFGILLPLATTCLARAEEPWAVLLTKWEQPISASDTQLPEEKSPDAIIARLDRLEAEWDAQQSAPFDASPQSAAACGCASGCSSADCSGLSFYAGAEITWMKPRLEDGAEEDANSAMLDFNHLKIAPRVWIGYFDPSEFGVRGRYWTYENTSSASGVEHVILAGVYDQMHIEIGDIDVEGVQRTRFATWYMDVGAGIRYGWFRQGVFNVRGGTDFATKRFTGIGPVLSVDFHRPWGFWDLAWVLNARGSLLVGEATWLSPTARQKTDDLGAVAELQAGLEWRREIRGFDFFARAVYEQQTWFGAGTYFSEPAGPGPFNSRLRMNDHDAALMGFSFAMGAMY